MVNIIEKRIDENGEVETGEKYGEIAVKKLFKNRFVFLIIAFLFILAFAALEFWDYYIPIEDIWI